MIDRSWYTPERGYCFMGKEEETRVKQQVLFDHAEVRKGLATLKEKALRLGREIEALGQMIQSEQEIKSVALECYQSLLSKETYQEIAQLKSSIVAAETELYRLAGRMRELGYGEMV
jgi:hypothetical protein